jgi:hypothetical protein
MVRAAGVSPPTPIHRAPGTPDSAKTIRAGHCRSGRCAIRSSSSAVASVASRAAAGTSQALRTRSLVMPTTTGSNISAKRARRRNHGARLTLHRALPLPQIARPLIARPQIARRQIDRPLIDRLGAVGRVLLAGQQNQLIPAHLPSHQVQAARSETVAVAPGVSCLVATRRRPVGRRPARRRPPKPRWLRPLRRRPLRLWQGAGRQRRPLILALGLPTAG